MASTATASIGAKLISASFSPNYSFGTASLSQTIDLPIVNQAINFLNGTGVGQINRIGIASGTLTNVTPTTTDTVSIDLMSLTDPAGASFTDLTKLCAVLILNDATAAGSKLIWDGTVTNGFVAPMEDVATAKIRILPGHVDPISSVNQPGIALFASGCLAGYAVDATHKIIKLYSGSAPSIPYRVVLLGRTA